MYTGSLIGWQWVGKRRRAGAAEADEGGNEGEASAVRTTIRLIEKERRKAMSRRMMREKERGKEIRRIWTWEKFSNFHRLSHPLGMFSGYMYRGAFLA